MSIFTNRSYNFIKRSPSFKSRFDRIPSDAETTRPSSKGVCRFVECVTFCCSQIVGLLKRSRPAAIFFEVAEVVVYSIYRHACRRVTHVFRKLFKITLPLGAHRNAATSPEMVFFILGVKDPCFYSTPNSIKSCLSHAVRRIPLLRTFFLQASTRLRMPVFELGSIDRCSFPTIAHTYPAGPFVTRWRNCMACGFNNHEPVELKPC